MKKMKKIVSLCLIATLTLAFATGCQKKSEVAAEKKAQASESASGTQAGAKESALLTEIKKRGYIEIGSSNDAPFSYQDVSSKELKGLDIEILKEICNRLGIPDIKMKVVDFSNLIVELNNKNIDMVVDGMYVKDDRLQLAAFSDKWYQEGEAVVIPKNSTIASKDDLKGKNVGAQPGTTFFDTAQSWLTKKEVGNVTSFDNQATLMTALNMGKVDAVVTDGIVAGYTLASDNTLNLKLLSPYKAEASGQIGSAVRFEDEDFLTEVNGALNAMKQDGTLLKILEKYGLTKDYFVDADAGKTKNVK